MSRFIIGCSIVSTLALLVYTNPNFQFYLKTPAERLQELWQKDFEKWKKNPNFQKLLLNTRGVKFYFSDPQVSQQLKGLKNPLSQQSRGSYQIKVSVVRWIHQYRYGYILQHEIFDSTGDKVHEFGRSYSVGFIW